MSTAGKKIDMLNGSLWDKILLYALPLAATGILQQLFNAADIAVVGRFTGENGAAAMAAVGANSPVIGLIVNTFIGISLGTNVVIANAVGRKDSDTVRRAVHTSIFIAVVIGLFVACFGEIFAVKILSAQNVPPEVLPMSVLYFRVYMAGVPVILLYNFLSAIFRGIGNTRTPLIALTLAGVINVILNLIFVLGLHMTVNGVALATVISNAISSCLLIISLAKSEGAEHIEFSKIKPDRKIIAGILRIGVPAGIQSAVFSTANMIIQSAINSLGTIVMAASSAAFNIEIFAYDVLNSFSQACTTFTGQNYGAGQIKRCKKALALSFAEGCTATALAAALILFFGRGILSVFNSDPEVIEIGYSRLLIIFVSYFFTLSYEVISGYLRGFGISVLPAVLTVIGICGVRITWIYTVFPKDRTLMNILTAYPVSLSTTAVLLLAAMLIVRPSKRAAEKESLSAS